MKENNTEFLEKIKNWIVQIVHEHPFYIYLVVMCFLGLTLLGLYLNWKWTYFHRDNINTFWMNFLHENFSEKSIRITHAVLTIIIMILVSFIYFQKFFK